MKDFNPFIHDHILHCERKLFCLYCLQDFTKLKYQEVKLMIALKVMLSKPRFLKMMNLLESEIMETK